MSQAHRSALVALSLSLAACGPTVVRAYQGPELSPQQVATLWSNENMSMSVDDQIVVPSHDIRARRRIELAPGRHVVAVICHFPDSIESKPIGGNGRTIEGTRLSRRMTFMLLAEAGHSYVPRAHFGVDGAGRPDCKVLFPDITGEPNGEKVQTF